MAWAWVALCVVAIFCVVPIARVLEAAVTAQFGAPIFLLIVFVCAVTLLWAALRSMRRRGAAGWRYAVLSTVACALGYYVFTLRGNPIEALHFVEYGLLALLVYRALTHSVRDVSIYFSTVLLVTTVGMIDEAVQWLTPDRYWGLEDIILDFSAAALVCTAIAVAVQPVDISLRWRWRGVRTLALFGCIATLTFLLTVVNTPHRIAAYSDLFPSWLDMRGNDSVMWEYGHRFEDPDIGVFRSRLSAAALASRDSQHAEANAAILNEYPKRSQYRQFLSLYTPQNAPFMHELRVHLFRRDVYAKRATDQEREAVERLRAQWIGYRENLIVERYYPQTLQRSAFVWAESDPRRRRPEVADEGEYDSPVSRHLITAIGEPLLLTSVLTVLVAFCALYGLANKRLNESSSKQV
ncbi:MAG: VanZ family protein [Pseudomonadota bacterium]